MRDGEIDKREREGAHEGDRPATTVVVGPDDDGLGAALADAGEAVSRVEGVPTGDALQAAGADEADLFVLTDVSEATTIAVVKESNPEVRVMVYDRGGRSPRSRADRLTSRSTPRFSGRRRSLRS